jgi:hypothetical protein
MNENENEYRTFGVLYVTLGIFFSVYFLLNEGIRFALFDSRILGNLGTIGGFFLIFVIALVIVVGSLVLALFGLVLIVRGGVWVARLSGVLCAFLFICYFGVMFAFFVVISG